MSTTAVAVARRREEFLAERLTGIGSSDIAALDPDIGSPWVSPWSIWARLVGLLPIEDNPTLAMELGTDLEPLIAEWFHRRTALHVEGAGANTLARHRRAPHHLAHLDGLVYDHRLEAGTPLEVADALGIFEAKFTGEHWDELPAHYRAQVQWALHVTGLPMAWVAALQVPFGRPRFDIFEVAADRPAQRRLAELADRFWEDHVVTGRAPLVDGHRATADAIAAAWGRLDTVRLPVVDLTDHRRVVDELAEARKNRATLERHIGYLEAEAKALFGEAALDLGDDELRPSEGIVDGDLAISWRARWVRRLDTDAVKADTGDRYLKPPANEARLELHGRWRP